MAMFPIRCLVETVDDGQCPQCSGASGTVVADSYAIVAGQTPLNQLVDTVMAALGLQHLTYGSKATLQLKNWKPLTFDQITDEQDVEIEAILKDVSNHLTLRILTKQSDNAIHGNMNDIKDRLLRAILQKMPNLLSEIQLPYVKDFISQLALAEQNSQTAAENADVNMFTNSLDEWSRKKINLSSSSSGAGAGQGQGQGPAGCSSADGDCAGGSGSPVGSAVTRFSQLLEVPKLERWFRENANPSRQKLFHYMHVLNASNFRKHTAKITYQQICNWFSNARAANRKRQGRSGGGHQSGATSNSNGSSSQQQSATGGAASGGGSMSASGGQQHQHHSPWSNKVFGSQVRGLSIAFNDFIQSPAAATTNGGINQYFSTPAVATSPKPTMTTGQGQQQNRHGQGHINASQSNLISSDDEDEGRARSSSVSSGADIKTEHLTSVDPTIGPMDNGTGVEITVNGGPLAIAGADRSSGSSPTLASISAVLNSSYMNAAHSSSSTSAGAALSSSRFNQSAAAAVGSASSANATQPTSSSSPLNPANRSRLMFDPLTELPLLEKWFEDNPHPSWVQIDQITDNLNMMAYRQTYPKVSSHNVKIWFKNRRAKCKRQVVSTDAMLDQKSFTIINKKFDEQRLQNSFLAE